MVALKEKIPPAVISEGSVFEPRPQPQWWVYILRCGDGTLYTGIALDVDERHSKHQAGKGAKYTRGRGPLVVVYRELMGSKRNASRRELGIKKLPRSAKELLVGS